MTPPLSHLTFFAWRGGRVRIEMCERVCMCVYVAGFDICNFQIINTAFHCYNQPSTLHLSLISSSSLIFFISLVFFFARNNKDITLKSDVFSPAAWISARSVQRVITFSLPVYMHSRAREFPWRAKFRTNMTRSPMFDSYKYCIIDVQEMATRDDSALD